jgi:ATP-binding cassette subfamily B protein
LTPLPIPESAGPLRRIAEWLRPQWRRIALSLGIVVLCSALEIGKPWPLKIVVDSVVGDLPLPAASRVGLGKQGLLLAACLGLLVLYVLLAVLSVVLNRITIAIGQRAVNELRARLLAHLQGLSLRFFGQRPAADLSYRIAFDTFSIQSIAMNGLFPLATAALMLAGMTVVLLRMNAALAVLFVCVGPLLYGCMRAFGRRLDTLSRQMRESESHFLSAAEHGIGSIQVVQAFTAEPREHARVMAASSRALSSALRLYLFQTGYSGVVNIVLALGTAGVLYAGGLLALAGRLTAGELIVFVTYLASLYGPINSIAQTFGLIRGGLAGARRVFEILDAEPEVRDSPRAREAGDVQGRIRFEGVSFDYSAAGDDDAAAPTPALRDVSFEVPAGAVVALVGPTGAGKTTLASLIPRFYDPSAGRILLDGVDLREFRVRSLRSRIGLVPQAPMLFPASIAENVRYGRPGASDQALRRAVEIAGVAEFAAKLPRGLDTLVGPEGQALSQGQAQRVTIARALLVDPRLLILDEPTSALDPETEAFVMRGIEHAMRGRTTFAIAHRLWTVRRADRLLVLDAGHLVETGTYESLRSAGGCFQRLVDAQELFDAEQAVHRDPP